jgi:hypothetical protein
MRIFVSYRRSDTQDFAGRLVDRLCEAPGVREVFFDVIGIEPGENFEAKLTDALARCEVCLVLIGADWRGERTDGPAARIEDPGDFVRLEALKALEGQARIIPILANGAAMPAPEDLPEELRELAKLNAVSVRHSDFDRDVDHLLDVMFERRKPAGLDAYLARHPLQRTLLRGTAGLAVALIALVAAAALHFSFTGHSLDQAVGGPGPTVLLIVAVLIGGAWAPSLLGRLRRRPSRG